MQQVAIDLETSGTDPEVSGVLSIGLVQVGAVPRELHLFVDQPDEDLVWTSTARTYFSKFEEAWATNRLQRSVAVDAVEAWLRETGARDEVQLIGHNVCFDYRFLERLFRAEGRTLARVVHHRLVDTHSILHFLAETDRIPPTAVSSTGAFRHFGIEEGPSRHTALGDAKATALLYTKLLQEFRSSSPRGPSET